MPLELRSHLIQPISVAGVVEQVMKCDGRPLEEAASGDSSAAFGRNGHAAKPNV